MEGQGRSGTRGWGQKSQLESKKCPSYFDNTYVTKAGSQPGSRNSVSVIGSCRLIFRWFYSSIKYKLFSNVPRIEMTVLWRTQSMNVI